MTSLSGCLKKVRPRVKMAIGTELLHAAELIPTDKAKCHRQRWPGNLKDLVSWLDSESMSGVNERVFVAGAVTADSSNKSESSNEATASVLSRFRVKPPPC
jgi:hypothetical protein